MKLEREELVVRRKSMRSPQGMGLRAQVNGWVLDQSFLCGSKEGRVRV